MRIEDNQLRNEFTIKLRLPSWFPKSLTKQQGEHSGFTYFGAVLFLIAYYLGWAKIYRNSESIDLQTYVETMREEKRRDNNGR